MLHRNPFKRFFPALVGGLLALHALPVLAAGSVRPFVSGTLAKIAAERQGRPFILSLWSISCTHCPAELRTLGKLKGEHPSLDVVLVSTDDPENAARTAEIAAGYGLGSVPQWIFADDVPERLRFEIDRRWYGELPRTLFFDRNHRVHGVSGLVSQERLQQWVKENLR